MTIPRIRTYIECMDKWKTVRSKEKGKPISSSIRMFRNSDGSFQLKQWGSYDLARIYPDNTLELLFDSPPNCVYETLPVYEENIAVGVYRVDHFANVPRGPYGGPDGVHMRRIAPEYFKGIKFNLITGECMNKQPDRAERTDHEISKQWKKDLMAFRRNIVAQAKLGALDGIVAEVKARPNRRFNESEFAAAWAAAMKGNITELFLHELVRKAFYYRYYRSGNEPPLWQRIDRAITSQVDSHRTSFKEAYGVYRPLP